MIFISKKVKILKSTRFRKTTSDLLQNSFSTFFLAQNLLEKICFFFQYKALIKSIFEMLDFHKKSKKILTKIKMKWVWTIIFFDRNFVAKNYTKFRPETLLKSYITIFFRSVGIKKNFFLVNLGTWDCLMVVYGTFFCSGKWVIL